VVVVLLAGLTSGAMNICRVLEAPIPAPSNTAATTEGLIGTIDNNIRQLTVFDAGFYVRVSCID